jgi:hypothetical protein
MCRAGSDTKVHVSCVSATSTEHVEGEKETNSDCVQVCIFQQVKAQSLAGAAQMKLFTSSKGVAIRMASRADGDHEICRYVLILLQVMSVLYCFEEV